MLKKFLPLLVLVLVFSFFPTSGAMATDDGAQFSDMPDNWATEALESAVENGLLKGFDGKIRPNNSLTRAEMAAVIVRAFGAAEEGDISEYADINRTDWFASDIAKAYKMGVMHGYDGKMNPKSSITREQVFTVVARAFKLTPAESINKTFEDVNKISDWAKKEVYALVNAGYIQGTNGKLNPKGNISRAEFAQVMHNLVKQYIKAGTEYSGVVDGNVMVNEPDLTLKNLTINGDLIVGDGVGDGDLILDNVTVKGRLLARGGGVNSIIISGGSVEGKVIITKVNGQIRVSVEGGADVKVVVVDDGNDDVIIEGTIETIEVAAPEVPVVIQNATVGNIEVASTGAAKITVSGNASVANVNVYANASGTELLVEGSVSKVETSAASTKVAGKGTVDTVTAKEGADNTAVTTPNTTINNDGASGVTAGGGTEVPENSSLTNSSDGSGVAPPASGGGGGSSGGGSSGGSSGGGDNGGSDGSDGSDEEDTTAPEIVSITVNDGTDDQVGKLVEMEGATTTFKIKADDENLYKLEVDINEGVDGSGNRKDYPSFTLYASEELVYGNDKAKEDLNNFGITASFDDDTSTWSLTVTHAGLKAAEKAYDDFKGPYEFKFALHDKEKNNSYPKKSVTLEYPDNIVEPKIKSLIVNDVSADGVNPIVMQKDEIIFKVEADSKIPYKLEVDINEGLDADGNKLDYPSFSLYASKDFVYGTSELEEFLNGMGITASYDEDKTTWILTVTRVSMKTLEVFHEDLQVPYEFKFAVHDLLGNNPYPKKLVILNYPDSNAPIIEEITVNNGNDNQIGKEIEISGDKTTFKIKTDSSIPYMLLVDINGSGNGGFLGYTVDDDTEDVQYPEFGFFATSGDLIYGDPMLKEALNTMGMTVSYDEDNTTWTLTVTHVFLKALEEVVDLEEIDESGKPEKIYKDFKAPYKFNFSLYDLKGNFSDLQSVTLIKPENTIDPNITSISINDGTESQIGKNIVMTGPTTTFNIKAEGDNLYRLEVDINEGEDDSGNKLKYPSFSLYAASQNLVYGNEETKDALNGAGITASYNEDNKTWTLTVTHEGLEEASKNYADLKIPYVFSFAVHDVFENDSYPKVTVNLVEVEKV